MKNMRNKIISFLMVLTMTISVVGQYPIYAEEISSTQMEDTETAEESVTEEDVQETESEVEATESSVETETNPVETEVTVAETEKAIETETETDNLEAEIDMSALTWENVPSMGWDDPENGKCEEQSAITGEEGIALFSRAASRKVKAYGVDVSSHNKHIDWKKVKAAGVDFAIIRVGGRGSSQGTIYKDDYALENIEGALAAGIQVGVYFYSTCINEREALEEAVYTCNVIKNYNITYPVVFDHEGYEDADYRNFRLSKSIRSQCARTFLDYVESQGYEGMMYSSASHLENDDSWETSTLEKSYDMWMAQYYWLYKDSNGKNRQPASFGMAETKPTWYTGEYRFWQCSSEGVIDGIDDHNVDLDIEYYQDGEEIPGGDDKTAKKLVLSNATSPETMNAGSSFSVRGTIASSSNLTSVTVGVYNTNGTMVIGKTVTPNIPVYDLKNVDTSIKFGSLAAGIYQYKVIAVNSEGTTTLLDKKFAVLSTGATVSNGTYYITTAKNTNYTLSIKSDSDAAGANVHLWQKKNLNYMQFELIYQSNGYYKIKNTGSGKYLGVAGQASGSGKNVEQQTDGTLWQILSDGNGGYYFVPKCSPTTCMDLAGANVANGTNIQIYALNMTQAQRWKLTAATAAVAVKPTISGAATPGTMTQEDSFSITGNISSDTKITSVTAGVYDVSGSMKTGKTVNPNTSSYSLTNLATSVKFNSLAAGIYRYKVTANNSAGTATLVEKVFVILGKDQTIANGTYHITSTKDSNYVLSIKSDSNADGANVHLWKLASSDYMKFTFEYQSAGYYKIKDAGSGKYLGVANQSSSSGANVEQQTDGTLWQVLPDGAGAYYLIPKSATGNCLDLSGNNTSNGRNIDIYTANMTTAQRWKLTEATTAAVKPTISGATTPGTMTQGSSFSIKGTISANANITSVTVGVYDAGGSMKIGKTITPNAKSYDLKNVDTSIKFGSLTAGVYRYKVTAVNSAGTATLVDKVFIVLGTGKNVADGTYYIASVTNPDYVLSIKSDSNAAGANVHLWKKTTTNYMKFQFTYEGNGYYKIKDAGSGKYLGVTGQSSSSGANVEQQTGGTLWQVLPDGTGAYYLVPKTATGCCLDLSGNNVSNGRNIDIYNANMTTAQRWKLAASTTAPNTSGQTFINYKTTEALNYRTGPGTSYSRVGTLSKGTTVQVVSGYSTKADGYTWYKIYLNGTYYYVTASYLTRS